MIDTEKVIKELKELHGSIETMNLISDAIALLKEQEPVEPFEEGINDFNCGKCGAGLSVDNDWKYCPHCGKKVKWE